MWSKDRHPAIVSRKTAEQVRVQEHCEVCNVNSKRLCRSEILVKDLEIVHEMGITFSEAHLNSGTFEPAIKTVLARAAVGTRMSTRIKLRK